MPREVSCLFCGDLHRVFESCSFYIMVSEFQIESDTRRRVFWRLVAVKVCSFSHHYNMHLASEYQRQNNWTGSLRLEKMCINSNLWWGYIIFNGVQTKPVKPAIHSCEVSRVQNCKKRPPSYIQHDPEFLEKHTHTHFVSIEGSCLFCGDCTGWDLVHFACINFYLWYF